MKISINCDEFIKLFEAYNRGDHFSRMGRRKLFEYFEQYEEDLGEDINIDIIAICCDFAEEKIETVLKDYNLKNIEELHDQTIVVEVDDDTIIYQQF